VRLGPAIDIVVSCHWWDVVADLAVKLKVESAGTIVLTGAPLAPTSTRCDM
jgi:hypothetical protein